jgi:hypothetical protein
MVTQPAAMPIVLACPTCLNARLPVGTLGKKAVADPRGS